MSPLNRHANTARYVEALRAAETPELAFVGFVRGLADPRVTVDIRNPIADLVDALDIVRGVE